MIKLVATLAFALGSLTACAMQPMTAEQQQAGRDLMNYSAQMQQASRQQPMAFPQQQQTRNCQVLDFGGGNYQTVCQ